jgi:hypothetical protein
MKKRSGQQQERLEIHQSGCTAEFESIPRRLTRLRSLDHTESYASQFMGSVAGSRSAMNETEERVRSYPAAVAARDFDLARSYLVDRGFRYTSPISSFRDPDGFIQSVSAVGPILARLDIRKCFVSGDEAIVILDTTLALSGYASYPSAMLFAVASGRIKSIEAIFDASDYHKMFSGDD